MALSRNEMSQLVAMASGLTPRNHVRFLSEAIQAVRDTGDPIAAVDLLAALRSSGYAERPNEQAALDDVGEALVRLLRPEPMPGPAQILRQLGWLKRLAASAAPQPSPRDADRSQHGRRAVAPARDQWSSIQLRHQLRRRRAEPPAPPPRRQPPEPPRAPAPTVLPAVFEVEFAHVAKARDARRTRTDREKKGKPPKDAVIGLVPTDPALARSGLASGLRCSTVRTAGMDAVFEELRKANGANVRFDVVRLTRDEHGPLATEIRPAAAAASPR